jgi:hypothetical protein
MSVLQIAKLLKFILLIFILNSKETLVILPDINLKN